jgi:hypothetical protein
VTVEVAPDKTGQPRLGVVIEMKIGNRVMLRQTVPPDEARTLAVIGGGKIPAEAQRALRNIADRADQVRSEILKRGESCSVVPPKITGPKALSYWVTRHAPFIRAYYRSARECGRPEDAVVWVEPDTESLDDPPSAGSIRSLHDLRAAAESDPVLTRWLDNPPRPGHFYVMAHCASGRLKGLGLKQMPVPTPDEDLPPVTTRGVTPSERN